MDNGLVLFLLMLMLLVSMCLNPYCSGQWPRTWGEADTIEEARMVLILIVVDNGLVHAHLFIFSKHLFSLNPYCSGQWPRTPQQLKLYNYD